MVKKMTVWLTDEQARIVEEYAKTNGCTVHKAIKVAVDGLHIPECSKKEGKELTIVTKPADITVIP